MPRSNKPDFLKNQNRVNAGRLAYARKKAAQDAADKPAMDMLKTVLTCLFIFGIVIFLAVRHH